MESSNRGKFRSMLLVASSVSGLSYLLTLKSSFSWISNWFRWCPTSVELQEKAEKKLFAYLKTPVDLNYIPVTFGEESNDCKLRSVVVNGSSADKRVPLVLLHGFASGIGLWILNIDSLSQDRPLYAPDIMGFGRSSRPVFDKDAEVVENQFTESIEQWRKKMGLQKFILLGHSMGGFLAASYALKYPERVKHLILADPWGFPAKDASAKRIQIPLWAKVIAAMLRPFNPLAALRAAGPFGPKLVERMRPDILRKYDAVSDPIDVANYIYHCNAQYPSGESAFKAMSSRFGWAKRPMIERISGIRQDVPITFIYGAQSWIDSSSGLQTSALRKDSFVEVKIIDGAGHHVYADRPEKFNEVVQEVCRKAEITSSTDHSPGNTSERIQSFVDDTGVLC